MIKDLKLNFRWKAEDLWVKNLLACMYLVLDIVKKFHSRIDMDLPPSFDIRTIRASRNEGKNDFTVEIETLHLPQR